MSTRFVISVSYQPGNGAIGGNIDKLCSMELPDEVNREELLRLIKVFAFGNLNLLLSTLQNAVLTQSENAQPSSPNVETTAPTVSSLPA